MTKQIDFVKTADDEYEASFVSTGPVTVQMQRKGLQPVEVSANIPDMPRCVTNVYNNPYNNGIIFGLDFPVGIKVTLRCRAEITKAMMMGDD